MTIWIVAVLILLILVFLQVNYNLFTPPLRGLPILMYHQVSKHRRNFLTVTQEQLSEHFNYLKNNGYTTIFFSELLSGQPLPQRPVILTFDDGYANNAELLYPLLKLYNFKATIFLPTAYLGKINAWDQCAHIGQEPIMSKEQLRSLSSRYVEFGLHSHMHRCYASLSLEEAEQDVRQCLRSLQEANIPFVPVLAYPFGAYPRAKTANRQFKQMLQAVGIVLGLRIGNRINKLPFADPYEVQRIDIRGTDSMWAFKTKLRKGRVKMC